MKRELTIVGIFYSGYQNVWKDFISLYKKNLNSKMFEFFIVSNYDYDFVFDGINVIGAGKEAEYSKKIQYTLEKIDSDYYLLLLEDFFFSKALNDQKILYLLNFIKNNKIKYYSMPMPDFMRSYHGKKYEGRRTVKHISEKTEYTISCQPAFWQKNFLRRCICDENYNAWIFEGIFQKSRVSHTKDFLANCAIDTSNPLSIIHGLVQGKMLPTTYRFFCTAGYSFLGEYVLMPLSECRKRRIKVFFISFFPRSLRHFLRKVLKKKSLTDKYNDTIYYLIKVLNLE